MVVPCSRWPTHLLVALVVAAMVLSGAPARVLPSPGIITSTERTTLPSAPSRSVGGADNSSSLVPVPAGALSGGCPGGHCVSERFRPISPSAASPVWTNLSSALGPPWTVNAAMAFDNGSQSVLLFGANVSGGEFGDRTWEFSGGVWKDISSTVGTTPPMQEGERMTYDAADGYTLMFGCPSSTLTGGACNDTWEFLAGAWHPIVAANPPLASDIYGNFGQFGPLSLAYDAHDSYSVLTNGNNTWKYVGGSWSPFCQVPTNCSKGFIAAPNLAGTATYDAHDGYVLFVGVDERSGSIVGGGSWTWKFTNGQWTNISSTAGSPPSPRLDEVMAYDSTTGGALLFGGTSCTQGPCGSPSLNDTWTFENGVWQNVTGGAAPPGRVLGQMADDPKDSLVVVFGGGEAAGSRPNDTWGWGASPPIAGLAISLHPSTPVPGSPVYFNATFEGGVGPFGYSWRFGDGGSSSLAAPSHTYATDGNFPVELWVNDSAGHSAHSSVQVPVYLPLAVEKLAATPNPAALDQPVNFSARAAGGTPPYTFAWSFGDGGTGGNLANITHIYTTNGPFGATVTVTDALGAVAQASLNISIKLEALAGSSTTSGASPLTVAFVGQAQGGVPPYQYAWDFGDGNTSTLQNPRHTYDSPGRYDVQFTVSDSKNNRSVSSLSIQVGGTGGAGANGFDWFAAFVIAMVAAASVATVWGVSARRQRVHRREGERWIEELTPHESPPAGDRPQRPS